MKPVPSEKETHFFRDVDDKHSIDMVFAVLGGRVKMAILWQLRQETLRSSELQRRFSETSVKGLTKQLRELEREGVVHRKIYPQVPPKVEYSLTEKGKSLLPILSLMCRWGKEYLTK